MQTQPVVYANLKERHVSTWEVEHYRNCEHKAIKDNACKSGRQNELL